MLVMAPAANVAVFDIDHAIQLGVDQEATQQYASAWSEAGGTRSASRPLAAARTLPSQLSQSRASLKEPWLESSRPCSAWA